MPHRSKKRRKKRVRLEKNKQIMVMDGVRVVLQRTSEKCNFHRRCGFVYVVATPIKMLKGKMKVCNNTLNDLELYAKVLKEERS